jgi:hypothetical protein
MREGARKKNCVTAVRPLFNAMYHCRNEPQNGKSGGASATAPLSLVGLSLNTAADTLLSVLHRAVLVAHAVTGRAGRRVRCRTRTGSHPTARCSGARRAVAAGIARTIHAARTANAWRYRAACTTGVATTCANTRASAIATRAGAATGACTRTCAGPCSATTCARAAACCLSVGTCTRQRDNERGSHDFLRSAVHFRISRS